MGRPRKNPTAIKVHRNRKQHSLSLNENIVRRVRILAGADCRTLSAYTEMLYVKAIKESKLYSEQFLRELFNDELHEFIPTTNTSHTGE